MLLTNVCKKGDTVTVKMSSSEEFIATYQEDDDNVLTVKKPVSLINTQQGMQMVPWIMTADDGDVRINKSHVTTWLKSQQDVSKMYTESTTGITLAK